MVPDRVLELLKRPVIGRSGTRDADKVPHFQRIMGWSFNDDRTRMTVIVQKVFVPSLRRCLESNDEFTANVDDPISHETYQLKGRVVETREVEPAEARAAEAYVETLLPLFARFGIPPESGRAYCSKPGLAVTFEVREVYDQTPGPGAGKRIVPAEEAA